MSNNLCKVWKDTKTSFSMSN